MVNKMFPETCEFSKGTNKKGEWEYCDRPWTKITDELEVYCNDHYKVIMFYKEKYKNDK